MSEQEPEAASEGGIGQSASTSGLGDWCPARSGTYSAYEPQWNDNGEWRRVPFEQNVKGLGVAAPLVCGGINTELGLCGYAQAMALAWWWAAVAASEGKNIEVRARKFRVVYDLKAQEVTETPNVLSDRLAEDKGE